MQIHVIAKAHLTNKALFYPKHVRDCASYPSDMLFYLRRRRSVQQLGYGPAELLPSPEKDHRSGAQGGPVIRRGIPSPKRCGNTYKSKGGDNGIAEMMPGVPPQGGALNPLADPGDVPGQQGFDRNHTDQDQKSIGMREFVRGANQFDAFRGNSEGGRNHGDA